MMKAQLRESSLYLFDDQDHDLMNLHQASQWASGYLNKKVTPSNLSYLVQYGRIHKYLERGVIAVSKKELISYYQDTQKNREDLWKHQLGDDLNWSLSFDSFKEKETTKHVHRLHPYKGKFIPQLVEYFLDGHQDAFKKEVFFQSGDIILDPFCGSGTTLVQANELGMHALGVDISAFNTHMTNVKVAEYDLHALQNDFIKISDLLRRNTYNASHINFEKELLEELSLFNRKYFPTPEFKIQVRTKQLNETQYAIAKEAAFTPIYEALLRKYGLLMKTSTSDGFIEKWFMPPIRDEIECLLRHIREVTHETNRNVLEVILSRTVRSCRATKHSDLGTLKEPIKKPYYCRKHGKICKPLFSLQSWWSRYGKDTLERLQAFQGLRTPTMQICLEGDARQMDFMKDLSQRNVSFAQLIKEEGIKGVFTSPPYIGLIDYHEQHAYAYEIFEHKRNDLLEIGSLKKGQGTQAREDYVRSIAMVLRNCKKYLGKGFHIFVVANDKYNLYPSIARHADLRIQKTYKRPVLNRTEKDKGAYSETIFHLR